MAKRLCLITGASAGIGEVFAREYAKRGWDLALVARRAERLDALAAGLKDKHGAESLVIPADLADPAAPEAIVEAIHSAGRQVDGLVNNAGYGLPGTFLNTTWEQQSAFLQLMVTSYAHLAHLVVGPMAERGFGRIINVASVAGLMPGSKGHTLYAGAKSLLIKLSQSLYFETQDYGVHVTAVCPGFTYSEFHDVNETRGKVSKLPKYWWMSAEKVVRVTVKANERNKPVVVPGRWNSFLTGLVKVMPNGFGMRMMRRQTARIRSETAPPT